MTAKKKPGTQRGAGQVQTSIVIPQDLLDQIEKIAKAEYRTRNNLIYMLLDQQVKNYVKQHGDIK